MNRQSMADRSPRKADKRSEMQQEEEKEKKYTGIANEFSISINTVKTHISKAYRLIRFPIDPALPSRYQIQKAFER